MFTGLIEHLGTVSSIITDAGGCTLTIAQSSAILGDCHIGDSIAVNGACLTVIEFDAVQGGGWFKVWLANETLDRTDLGERKVGDQVNLERAMGAHVRFGGHFVQAHVDGTATIIDRAPDGESLRLTFQFPPPTAERPSLLLYIIPKGYVTIDGASLTITGVNDAERTFSVMLIKHTQEMITLSKKAVGSTVNIEVDMVGKYVQKGVVAALGGGEDQGLKSMIEKIVEDVLAKKDPLVTFTFLPSSMDSGATLKPKVTGKLTSPVRPPSRTNASSRPSSPTKSYVSTNSMDSAFRPRAKVNSSATSRRTVASSTVGGSASSTPRAGSPTKLNQRIKSPVTAAATTNGASRTTLKSPSNTSSPVTPELRKTATASSSLRVAAGEEYTRSRTGSVSLHHAVSFSSFQVSSSSSSVVSSSPRIGAGVGPKTGTVSASASPRLVASKSIMHLNTNTNTNTDRNQNSSPTLKIRAKVSNLAKAAAADASVPPSPTSPAALSPIARSGVRTRAPSTSSSALGINHVDPPNRHLTSPPPQFYPITTAVPAANPHRFPSSRPTAASTISTSSTQQRPAVAHHIFQSFSQSSSSSIDTTPPISNYNAQPTTKTPSTSPRPRSSSGRPSLNGIAKVDPASIPLPPHSPPISSVSFSSRSSVSRSSASPSYVGTATDNPQYTTSSSSSATNSAIGANNDAIHLSPSLQHNYHGQIRGNNMDNGNGSAVNGDTGNMRDVLDNLMQYTSAMNSGPEDDDDEGSGVGKDGEEHKVKAEAKSNRKIADLEITNRSLLVINASLEATKHRQAKEIQELRRKLRESRLILPPRAYRAVKSSLDPEELGDDEEDVEDEDEEWFDADDGGSAAGGGNNAGSGDEIYKRIKMMLEALLKTGQEALDRKTEDFGGGAKGAAKVLSPQEVKDWRGGADDHDGEHDISMDSSFLLESESESWKDNMDGMNTLSLDQRLLRPQGVLGDEEGLRRISEGSSYYTSEEGGEEEDSFFNDSTSNIANDTVTSEDEVEAMTISGGFSPPGSPSPQIPPPPILITKPTL